MVGNVNVDDHQEIPSYPRRTNSQIYNNNLMIHARYKTNSIQNCTEKNVYVILGPNHSGLALELAVEIKRERKRNYRRLFPNYFMRCSIYNILFRLLHTNFATD